MIRDHFQFAVLGVIALGLVVAETILAVTGSSPAELHAALLVVLAGLLGVAAPGKPGP